MRCIQRRNPVKLQPLGSRRGDGSTVKRAGQIRCSDRARWAVQREFNRRILNTFAARCIEMAGPQHRLLIVNAGVGAERGLQRTAPRRALARHGVGGTRDPFRSHVASAALRSRTKPLATSTKSRTTRENSPSR